MSRTLVILNPAAGGGADAGPIEGWRAGRPGVELRRTRGKGDAELWAREAAEEGADLIVAAGGDGTLHEVGCGILASDASQAVLGVLPLGTGNDLARSLGISEDPAEAVELLDRGHRRALDAVRMELDGELRFFFNALTGGFSGEIHEKLDAEVKASWGPLSYLRSGLETWGERSPYGLEVEVDGEAAFHEALNLVVANGGSAGSGIPVAPGADPFDGLLDVVVVLEAPALELSALAARMLAGEAPDDHQALVRRRGRSVRVRAREPLPVSVDGEAATAREMTFQVVPGALPVMAGP